MRRTTFRTTTTTTAACACMVAVAVLTGGCGRDNTAGGGPARHPAAPDIHRPPAGVTWSTYQGMRVPAGNDGPHDPSRPDAAGYTHTPQGAALAAINDEIRMSVASDDDWPAIAHTLLADSPGKQAFVTSRALVSVTPSLVGGDATPRVTGYRITGYHPDRAAVVVYTRLPDRSTTATTTDVVWRYNDWRLVPHDPHDPTNPVTAVTTPPPDTVRLEAPQS